MIFKFIYLLSFILLPYTTASAYFKFAPGVFGSGALNSTQTSTSTQLPLLQNESSGGLGVDLETSLFLRLSLLVGGNFTSSSGLMEYQYTNPLNSADAANVSSLKSSFITINGYYGLRFSPIMTSSFNLFLGAGGLIGSATITPDKDDFSKKQSSTIGYKSNSNASLNGHYYELGMEYFWNKQNGLRFLGRKVVYQTNDFDILGNKILNFSTTQFGVHYIHLVDFSFFWK